MPQRTPSKAGLGRALRATGALPANYHTTAPLRPAGEVKRTLERLLLPPWRIREPDGALYGDGIHHFVIDSEREYLRVIVSAAIFPNGETWTHASMSWERGHREGRLPAYRELSALHKAVFGDRYAYQVFAPSSDHYTYAEVLHLWGRHDDADGRVLPDFAVFGTI